MTITPERAAFKPECFMYHDAQGIDGRIGSDDCVFTKGDLTEYLAKNKFPETKEYNTATLVYDLCCYKRESARSYFLTACNHEQADFISKMLNYFLYLE